MSSNKIVEISDFIKSETNHIPDEDLTIDEALSGRTYLQTIEMLKHISNFFFSLRVPKHCFINLQQTMKNLDILIAGFEKLNKEKFNGN